MSGGILRFPWTSQPQTLTPLNPAYKAIGAYTPITSAALNQAKKYPSLVAINAPTVGAGPAGLQWNLNGSSQYFSANLGAAQLEGFTIIAIGTPTNVTTGGAIVTIADTTLSQGSYGIRINAGVVGAYAYSSAGALNESVHAVSAVNNKTYVFGAVFASTALRTVYLNGTPGTPNTTSGAVTSASQFSIGVLNRSGITQYWPGGVNGVFVLPLALTDAEMARMKTPADVWAAMYAPIQRTIWVPAAAGGGATYTLTADSGSFALTGQTTGLAFNRVLAADTQSFSLTGQTTGLAFNRTLSAASGSFALTGQDAGLAFNRVLSAENGSYALGGQDVTLTYTPISGATYTLTAASGSFALTGQDTVLAFNRVLTADTQSYSLSGDFAGLAFNRVLTANTVSYALTGQDVTLTYTGNTYTLNAESGTFFVDGQDANLVYSGGSSADTGDGSMSRKRYYLRRKGKILLFDTAAQADDYLEAEEEAQKAIATAKSRGAKKRIAAKILKAVEPVESVEIAPLQELVKAYSVPVNLPQLLSQQDYSQVMDVRAMIQRIQDDEDDELLLLLA